LNQQFFKTESVPPTSPHRISFPQQEIKRTLPGTQQFSSQEQSVSYAHRTQSEQSVKDNQSDKISSKNSSGERKQVILNLLKTKTEVSVSDVLKELPNVSDKTVQRELVGMVESGVLQKKGEKRWSTYSLKPLP
jgi:predicted HTH transcriptional regulator